MARMTMLCHTTTMLPIMLLDSVIFADYADIPTRRHASRAAPLDVFCRR